MPPKVGAPIKLTLYNPETNDQLSEHVIMFVPWRFLKAAMRLSKKISGATPDALSEDDIDELTAFVVVVFGNRFTVDQLNDGADITEMITVINAIVARAAGLMPNPTPPGK